LLVSLGVIVGALTLTSGLLEGRYEIHLRVEEAEGLTQDTRVVLQGLQIGRVTQVTPHLDSATNALDFVATLSIREKFPDGTRLTLPAGTHAIVAPPANLVGPTVILLVMPDQSRGAVLGPNDTIPAERRRSVIDQLSEVAAGVRASLDSTLTETRTLIDQTTQTVRTGRTLLRDMRPQVVQLLDRLNESLGRAQTMLATVEPRVEPVTDSLVATLAGTHALVQRLDSLTSLAHDMATENRTDIRETIDKLARAAVTLEHFADQVSRRPLRMLTGVTPPEPPDTTDEHP
jgi:ABC-type transporter Mla subunit MlaD